jgi:hypothetical protein
MNISAQQLQPISVVTVLSIKPLQERRKNVALPTNGNKTASNYHWQRNLNR